MAECLSGKYAPARQAIEFNVEMTCKVQERSIGQIEWHDLYLWP